MFVLISLFLYYVPVVPLCAVAVGILLKIAYPYSEYVLNIIYRLVLGKTEPLPPINDEILLMSAIEIAEKIRKRQLSCKRVMRTYIERAEQIHRYVNAVTDERYAEAQKEAETLDMELAKNEKSEQQLREESPLLGVPFTCKESIGINGLAQTSGMYSARGHLADEDCHAAASYRKAGAIPIAVTNVPETCMWWETANHIYGRTKNPYDVTRSVGGSTGGEGAMITSAGSVIGIGTDIGGSIRLPSSFCGIYGHKPSRGIVSNWGAYPHCHMTPDRKDTRVTLPFLSTGPMCRYAQDLPLLLRVLSGNDERLRMDEKVNFRNVKVYYMEEIPGLLTSALPDVKMAIRKATTHLQTEYGMTATQLQLDELPYALDIYTSKFREVDAPPLKEYLEKNGSKNSYWELLKALVGASDFTLPIIFCSLVVRLQKDKTYHANLKRFQSLQKQMDGIFEEDAVFLFPTQPEPPPHYLMTLPKFTNLGYTAIFNLLGYPVTNVPAGLSGQLPIGIQVVSGQFKDHLTIATAIELDKVFKGWRSPCDINV